MPNLASVPRLLAEPIGQRRTEPRRRRWCPSRAGRPDPQKWHAIAGQPPRCLLERGTDARSRAATLPWLTMSTERGARASSYARQPWSGRGGSAPPAPGTAGEAARRRRGAGELAPDRGLLRRLDPLAGVDDDGGHRGHDGAGDAGDEAAAELDSVASVDADRVTHMEQLEI